MSIKRIATIVFLIASAAMLAAAALVFPWWEGQLAGGSFEIDLRGMRMCADGQCGEAKALSLADSSGVAWAKVGISTFAASLVAASLLMVCIWKTVLRRPSSTFFWIAGALSFFAGVLALLFMVLRPDFGEWTPSYGLACGLAGAIVGAIAASGAARVAQTEVKD